MKAAYANLQPVRAGKWNSSLALGWSSEASQAQGTEAFKVLAAAQKVQQHLDEQPTVLILRMEGDDALSYNHVAPKRVFSVKTQYKYIGRMKPRQFPLDE